MDKINWKEAIKLERGGCYLIHLDWIERYVPNIVKNNPDCSHMVCITDIGHKDTRGHLALILTDGAEEHKYLWNRSEEYSRAMRRNSKELLQDKEEAMEVIDQLESDNKVHIINELVKYFT